MSVDVYKNLSKNGGFDIIITHVPTATTVSFPGFVTNFSDNTSASFTPEQVYGRMDNIVTYKGTTRSIDIAFDVLSESLETAIQNMQNFAILARMMYPKFSKIDNAETMSLKAPPLLKIRYANLIKDSFSDDGLLCAADRVSFKPDLTQGVFTPSDQPGKIYAKKYDLSFRVEPLHTHKLGWDEENNWMGGDSWPFTVGAPTATSAQSPPPATSQADGSTTDAVNASRADAIMGGS